MTEIILLDGGMGQELLKRSAFTPSPLWSAQVLMDEPEIVEAVHLDYINAGARVITLNSYSVTPERLERDGDLKRFRELQAHAISIARSAREKSGKKVSIAGCLPPMMASYRPDLAPDYQSCLTSYRKIVAEQKNHVDIFICETLASAKEVRAATTAAAESGKPVWTSMSVIDGDGTKLRSGELLGEGVKAALDAGANGVLVNCSWPESLTQSIAILATSNLPFGAYANGFSAIDKLAPGGTVEELVARDDLGPRAYSEHAMRWVAGGATIVGGCCETGPAHISELASKIRLAGHEIIGADDQ
ncbi:MAG: homocysteine S-methyltransferase family protein [Rhizobiaceae bacterium]|nr:homocysteine S-methyltransferase family protein [Rhizobiaceae bacterium]